MSIIPFVFVFSHFLILILIQENLKVNKNHRESNPTLVNPSLSPSLYLSHILPYTAALASFQRRRTVSGYGSFFTSPISINLLHVTFNVIIIQLPTSSSSTHTYTHHHEHTHNDKSWCRKLKISDIKPKKWWWKTHTPEISIQMEIQIQRKTCRCGYLKNGRGKKGEMVGCFILTTEDMHSPLVQPSASSTSSNIPSVSSADVVTAPSSSLGKVNVLQALFFLTWIDFFKFLVFEWIFLLLIGFVCVNFPSVLVYKR